MIESLALTIFGIVGQYERIQTHIITARKVPVPSCIGQMIDDWVGDLSSERLFKFPVNSDGVAQNSASKRSMYYIRKITDGEALVTHSFRHKFLSPLQER